MADLCAKCGTEIATDFAFCGACGTPVPRGMPLVARRDRARIYDADVETTLDLQIENLGGTPLTRGVVEVSSPSLPATISRRLAEDLAPGRAVEVCVPGFRPPPKADALLVTVSIAASKLALVGEFKVRVRRAASKSVNIIMGNNNILDQARFGGATVDPDASAPVAPEWETVPLRPQERTTVLLVVRQEEGEQSFSLGEQPISFGRRKETNQVVVRVPGDDPKAVNCISRNHLTLALRQGQLIVKDMSSTGTSLNARPLGKGGEAEVGESDVIGLGGAAEFRVSLEREGVGIRRVILSRTR